MVAYRDCKGHLVCMADAQTGIVEIQHKDRACGRQLHSDTARYRNGYDANQHKGFSCKKPSPRCVSTKENNKSAELQDGQDLAAPLWGALCPGRLLFFP